MAASSPASTPTLLLLDLPPSIFCGIDLLSFTTTAAFQGIKDLPSGFHFLFTSETNSISIREGFWFHIPKSPANGEPPLVVRKWDAASNSMLQVADPESYRSRLSGLWEKNLSPYRQSAGKEAENADDRDWEELTQHVTTDALTRLMQNGTLSISTVSCMPEDRDEIPGLTSEETGLEEQELQGLGINLKRTWREGAVGRERTEGAVDRSWALGDVAERFGAGNRSWGDSIFSQMEVCFLMVLTVVNYSCLEEWKRCVGLVLGCKTLVSERQAWFAEFLKLLQKQIKRCEDVDGGLFDMADEGGNILKGWLKGFRRSLSHVFNEHEGQNVKDELEELESVLKMAYDWQFGDEVLRKGNVQLEDGEMVELEMKHDLGLDGEEEDGEYAPVIVET